MGLGFRLGLGWCWIWGAFREGGCNWGLGVQLGGEVGFGAGAVNRDGEHIYGGGLRERVQAAMRGWGRKRIGAGGAIGGLGVQVGLWGG